MANCNLYEELENYIQNYMDDKEEFDWDEFLDGLEDTAQKLYPENKIEVWTYEIDNDTFRVDRAFNDLLKFAKYNTIVSYSTNWDNERENLIITIVSKGD